MPTAHALLAPSAAKRWMRCTPSARLEALVPDRDSAFSREGTIAHAMAEYLLGFYLIRQTEILPDDIADAARDLRGSQDTTDLFLGLEYHLRAAEEEGVDPYEMLDTVHEKYVRRVYESYLCAKKVDPEATLLIEARLKLAEFIPEGFGSSDAVLLFAKQMIVYDLKYGKGVKVEATENEQMMCYALGAYCGPAEFYPVEQVTMTIIQPRLGHESSYSLSLAELLDWGENRLKPAALKAYKGEGLQVPGEHCKFCKVAAQCRALRDAATAPAENSPSPELMTPEELADALSRTEMVKAWLNSIESFTLDAALNGMRIPGYKLVEGRSIRVITDPAEAMRLLEEAGFEESAYIRPKELKTISDLEKTLKKKAFTALLGHLVNKPAGKPTLVKESDPRPELSNAENEFKELNDSL